MDKHKGVVIAGSDYERFITALVSQFGNRLLPNWRENRLRHFCNKLLQNWAEGRFRQFGDKLSPNWAGCRFRHFCDNLSQKYRGVRICISSTRCPSRPPACIVSRPRRGLAGPVGRFLTRLRQALTSMLCWKRRRTTSRLPCRRRKLDSGKPAGGSWVKGWVKTSRKYAISCLWKANYCDSVTIVCRIPLTLRKDGK